MGTALDSGKPSSVLTQSVTLILCFPTFSFLNQDVLSHLWGFPGGSDGKESPCNVGDSRDAGLIPWRRERPSTPVILPGEFHEQSSLADFLGLHITEKPFNHD